MEYNSGVEEHKSFEPDSLFPNNPELQDLANKLLKQHFSSSVKQVVVEEKTDSKTETNRLYATDRRIQINPDVAQKDAKTTRWGNVDTTGIGSAIGLSSRQMPLLTPLRPAGIGGLI